MTLYHLDFSSLETAKSAKDNLHGCDIYSGCCTLKVEFAKPTKLNVYRNDNDSWDYTNPNLGLKSGAGLGDAGNNNQLASQRPVLLKEPLMNSAAATSPNSAAAAAAAASTRHAAIPGKFTENISLVFLNSSRHNLSF